MVSEGEAGAGEGGPVLQVLADAGRFGLTNAGGDGLSGFEKFAALGFFLSFEGGHVEFWVGRGCLTGWCLWSWREGDCLIVGSDFFDDLGGGEVVGDDFDGVGGFLEGGDGSGAVFAIALCN